MLAIVGLGNPGEQYAHTRHNAGFDTLDLLAERLNLSFKKLRFRGVTAEGIAEGKKFLLLKPQTFMNLSGLSVSDLLSFYNMTPEQMLVVVDDIDLPFGQVRVRAKGGPGTHNGLRSIVQCTASGDFPRVRVGMGAPPPEWDLADFVLGHFNTPEERKIIYDAYQTAADAAIYWLTCGIDKTMNEFNRKHAP